MPVDRSYVQLSRRKEILQTPADGDPGGRVRTNTLLYDVKVPVEEGPLEGELPQYHCCQITDKGYVGLAWLRLVHGGHHDSRG
ncbi:MAG TPA: hypothetical protein VMZ92_05745 [Planctomycetota bacterium]|nr:hypothetical protein [Planctomycetota bacterium]